MGPFKSKKTKDATVPAVDGISPLTVTADNPALTAGSDTKSS